MLRGETILLGTARTEGATDRARRAARGGAAREPQRDARPDRGTRRPAGAARTKSRVDGCVPPLPSTGTAKGANQTRHTESGVRPRCGSRMKRPGTGDRHASTIVASCGRPNHGLSARSIGPGFVARSPEPRFIAARAGASRRTRRGSAIVRTCRCRLPAIHPQRVETKPNCKFAPKSSRAIPASRPPKVHSYGCRHRQRTLTELANTPVASVEMITSRQAHVGITRPTSTSSTILTPMKTRSSATACCRYWNDLISPTTNV